MIDIVVVLLGVVGVLIGASCAALIGRVHVGRNPPEPKDKRPSALALAASRVPPVPYSPYPYESHDEAREAGM